jgi:hypothetical protein
VTGFRLLGSLFANAFCFFGKFRTESYVKSYGSFELSPNGFHNFLCWLNDGGINADYHWSLQTAHDEKVTAFYNKESRNLVSELFDSDFRILGYPFRD